MNSIDSLSNRIPPWAWLVAVALVLFLSAFYVYQNLLAPTDHVVDNLLVLGRGNVRASMSSVLSPHYLTLHIATGNVSDTGLACLASAAAEASSALGAANRNVTVQGIIASSTCVDVKKNAVACLPGQVLVTRGTCNCLRVDETQKQIVIEGNDLWLCSNAPRIRAVLKWALSA